jgi:hypothetical protein
MEQNDPDWVMIYSTTLPHKINIVKAVLEDNQIKSFDVNKKDSSYIFIGDIDLYVHKHDEVLARFLIKTHDL